MDCFGSRALRSIYGQLACLRLTWGCLLRTNADCQFNGGTGARTLRRWEHHSVGIRALAQCSCALYTSALCALQAPVSLDSDFGTTEDAGERSGDLGWISHALAGCNKRGVFSDRSVTCGLPPHGVLAMCLGRMQKKRTSHFFLLCINCCWQHAAGKD